MIARLLSYTAALGLCAGVGAIGAGTTPVAEPGEKTTRKLLYPADARDVAAALKPHVEKLLDANQKSVDPGDTRAGDVYLRVVSRRHILDGEKLKAGGWLGPRPFAFLTVPEAAYGRDLLGTLSAIGYDPEDILDSERGVEKVALVFAYPDKVRSSDVRDGTLPDDWDRRVHVATWDNVFSLTDRMVAEKERWVALRRDGDGFFPAKLQFRSDREVAFALGFPDEGKKRVKATDYAALREVGGADWAYRQLVERLFGASEHFRGDGRTKLTLAGKKKPRVGFPELLGPNAELKDIPVLAVVSLGAIRVGE